MIIRPSRFTLQPQYIAPIDYEGLGKGVQLLMNPGVGLIDTATNRHWAAAGNARVTAVSYGNVYEFDGVNDDLNYTGYSEIKGTVGTFFIWCPTIGPQDDFGQCFLRDSGTNYTVHSSSIFYHMGSPSDRTMSWFNTTNQSLVCSSAGTTGAGLKVYKNGVDTGMLFSAGPNAFASGSRFITIGRAGGTVHDFSGTIRVVGYTTAVWGASEARAFHEDTHQLYKISTRIFVPVSSSPVTGTLAYTNADDTLAASGSTAVVGTLAYTNTDDALAASGATSVVGSLAVTNANDTVAASGTSGASSQFASDSFTDTDDVTLQAHDANWVKHTSGGGNDILITANRAQQRTIGEGLYYHVATPSSADYSVSADLYVASRSPDFNYTGVLGRVDPTALTFYQARYGVAVGWQLTKSVAGVATNIVTEASPLPVAGNTYRLKLDMSGSTIKLLVDGAVIIEVTDSSITAAGKAGLRAFINNVPTTSTGLHFDNFSADEAGGSSVTGTVAVTNADDTIAATGTTTVTGSLATTNANDTLAASGSPIIVGSLATTNADDTGFASGSVGSEVSGTVAYTNIDDSAAASGTTTVVGSAAVTNANDTASAEGTTTVTGTSSTTNADDTCAASGEVIAEDITGTVAYTNADDTASASGTTTIVGSAAASNSNDTLSAFGTVNNGVMVEAALVTGIATSSGIKKPGIPENAPAWLRTTLEILEGRRGNRVTIPAAANLTFSATPTQAECEALYEYTNEIRTALSSIISRFDS